MNDNVGEFIKEALNKDRARLTEIIRSDIERVKKVEEGYIQYVITPSAMDQGSTLSALKPSWLNRNREFEMETVWRLRSDELSDVYEIARKEVLGFLRQIVHEQGDEIKIECYINGNGEVELISE